MLLALVIASVYHIAIFNWIGYREDFSEVLFLPLWARVLLTNCLATVGIFLTFLASKDRERTLGIVFLLVATSFADSTLLRHPQALEASNAIEPIINLPLDALFPYFLWRFFSQFPSSSRAYRLNFLFKLGRRATLALGLILVTLHLLEILTSYTSYNRAESTSLYWTVIFLSIIPIFPLAYGKTRSSLAEERTRATLFITAISIPLIPIFTFILVTLHPVAKAWALSDTGNSISASIILFLLCTTILSSAYALVAGNVFELKLQLSSGLRHTLAACLINTICYLPTMLIAAVFWSKRHQPLVDATEAIPVFTIIAAILVQFFLLYSKETLRSLVDKSFFRDKKDIAKALLNANQVIPYCETADQLTEAVLQSLNSGITPTHSGLLLVDPDNILQNQSRQYTAAPASFFSQHQQFLKAHHSVTVVFNNDASLSQPAQSWFDRNSVQLLLLLKSIMNDELIGTLACGAKKSEQTYSAGDLHFIKAIGSLCESALSRFDTSRLESRRNPTPVNHPTYLCKSCSYASTNEILQCPLCQAPISMHNIASVLAGRYQIDKVLGNGAMGSVYKATDILLNRQVAVKTLRTNDPHQSARIAREARVAASLNHPNLAQIYAIEYQQDEPFLVLELMQMGTLRDRLADLPLSEPELRNLAHQTRRAISHLHNLGYVHGDIKPDNIGYTANDAIKLLDFGISRISGSIDADMLRHSSKEAEIVVGTPAYASPGLIKGQIENPKNDIWALGITLFEAATLTNPHAKKTIESTRRSILRESPPLICDINSSISREFSELVANILNWKYLDELVAKKGDIDSILNNLNED